jgi:hypothetical protein
VDTQANRSSLPITLSFYALIQGTHKTTGYYGFASRKSTHYVLCHLTVHGSVCGGGGHNHAHLHCAQVPYCSTFENETTVSRLLRPCGILCFVMQTAFIYRYEFEIWGLSGVI